MRRPVLPVRPFLALRRSAIHGSGVYARASIPAGTRIIEYRGERISNAEADRRYPDGAEGPHHTFLFALDDGETVIDATFGGNMARWINHSCDPNCEPVEEDARMYIESIRDIEPGEELAYDYNYILPQRHTPAQKRRFPCRCGAATCRGTILGKKR